MPLLALRDVEKSFGSLTVADRVTLDVEEGEALGIIGPNGAGKSTLFNLVTGNLAVDGGTIALDGEDVTRASARSRCLAGVGRSFQVPQPFGDLTVFENLVVAATFGSNLAEREVTVRCGDILERTGLAPKANAVGGALSLLERKRLELARALATNPRLLLLDEIAGGLTEAECRSLIQTIREVHASGVTIVWIEHVVHALLAVVDRLVVLDFGKVIATGPANEVMASREVREIYMGIEV